MIIGGDDLSNIFGVYTFLEEYQGCGWFLPGDLGEVVPPKDGILIPGNIDITRVPDIPIRWMGGGDWALKNHSNIRSAKLPFPVSDTFFFGHRIIFGMVAEILFRGQENVIRMIVPFIHDTYRVLIKLYPNVRVIF